MERGNEEWISRIYYEMSGVGIWIYLTHSFLYFSRDTLCKMTEWTLGTPNLDKVWPQNW
jgi:hypothetical protein